MPCPRCGGGLVKDLDQSDRFKCSQCSRFFRSKAAAPPDPLAPPPPPPPHPHGDGSWGQKLQRKRKRCECGQSFRPHPNGQRVQCAKCQLANQATQRREERARKGKWCKDCQTPIPTSGMSPRCDDCRLAHYRATQARSARERREFKLEAVGSPLLKRCLTTGDNVEENRHQLLLGDYAHLTGCP